MNKHIGKEIIILSNKMKRYLNNKKSEYDITNSQSRILRFLYFNNKDIFYNDLEKEFDLRGSSINGLIDNLIKKNYINVDVCISDKRKKKITLSDKGKKLATILVKEITEFENDLNDSLTKEELTNLYTILDKLHNFIDEKEREND